MDHEEKQIDVTEEMINSPEEKKKYHPRPAWQVWAARIGLVIMIISVILYYIHIATGGLI